MKDKNAWQTQPVFPVIYAQNYLHVARERGLDSACMLASAGLHEQLLSDQNSRISPQAFRSIVAAIIQAGGDDGLGFEVGWRTPPTAHGSLGYALLCSGSLAEASAIIQRYRHLRGRGMQFLFTEQPDYVMVEFKEDVPFGDATLHRVMVQGLVSGFYRAIQILLADGSQPGEIWFDHAQPDYFSRYQEHLPEVRFSMPSNQIRLSNSVINRPLPMANPAALQLALQQCEREETLLGQGEEAVLKRVRAELILRPEGYPTPEQLADKLHMSPRTFRRKLFEQGSSYKQVLEDARRRDAMLLLDKHDLEIQKVAELLGYQNPANFTRAFREWTGRSPNQFRELRKAAQKAGQIESA